MSRKDVDNVDQGLALLYRRVSAAVRVGVSGRHDEHHPRTDGLPNQSLLPSRNNGVHGSSHRLTGVSVLNELPRGPSISAVLDVDGVMSSNRSSLTLDEGLDDEFIRLGGLADGYRGAPCTSLTVGRPAAGLTVSPVALGKGMATMSTTKIRESPFMMPACGAPPWES